MKKQNILICGAGSIGVYLGIKLNSKKNFVKLFGRRKLRNAGQEVYINNKKYEVPERLFKAPKNQKYDYLFVTTKLYDFDYMVKTIKKNKIQGIIVSAVQNGLVDISKYSKELRKRIIPVVVFSGFNLSGNTLKINPTPTGWRTEPTKQGKKISKLLLFSGIPCYADKNFQTLRAEKTIVNCCLNALSAIEKKPFSELFKIKKIRERIENLFSECYDILKKEYDLDDKSKIKKRMFNHWSKLKHYSSTYQDLNSGRKLETKFFNGYLIKLGKKHNLPTKHNKEVLIDINKISRKR